MPPLIAPPGRALPARVAGWLRDHRKAAIGLGVVLAAAVAYPWAVGGIVAGQVAKRASARLGRTVTVAKGRAGLGKFTLTGLRIEGAVGADLLSAERVVVPMGVAFGGKGPVQVAGVRAYVVRGGSDDNVTSIIERLRGKGQASEGGDKGGKRSTPPGVVIERARVELRDRQSGVTVTVDGLDGEVLPGERVALRARGLRGVLALAGDEGPRFGADEADVQAPLEGLRPSGLPAVRLKGGFASPLPTLSLTGIAGVIAPPPGAPAGAKGAVIDLSGSYGGARETLWTAKGKADLERQTGALSLRAEQFSLDKIADVLPKAVLRPESTTLDAAFDVAWADGVVKFGGDLAAVGVSLQNAALAADPVENVSLGLALRGSVTPAARRIELEKIEARVRDLTARLSGTVELPRGTYKFENGRKLGVVPKLDLAFSVPRLPCAKLLASIPPALLPRLQGFVLQGFFQADVAAKIDFAALEGLTLDGKVGIDGCKVVKAPEEVTVLAEGQSIIVNVEVPMPPGGAPGETETLPVIVGPESPDFTPFEQISPALISSIMTTEDNGFFRHHGFVTSEFKSALRRNLVRGGFRMGASSITMQMVKNVLLSQEKTLSRKVQELFLVWYLEQQLPKERILELYFNAIEFGPRIYGIGAASRHYFGKKPSELTPVEAAFFSSILPSPKRRYVQYCHGALLPQWDKYIHRIVAKVHERGRMTDEEYTQWAQTPLVFDRSEATFKEKQCLDWVKAITTARNTEPDAPPELDDADEDEGDTFAARKLRRIFDRGPRARGATTRK